MNQPNGSWAEFRVRLDAASAAVTGAAIVIAEIVADGRTPHPNTVEKYRRARSAKAPLVEKLDAMAKADARTARTQS